MVLFQKISEFVELLHTTLDFRSELMARIVKEQISCNLGMKLTNRSYHSNECPTVMS
jgi:hypothetical protein